MIYYLFLFTTLGTAIYSVKNKKVKGLSILTIVFTITIPIICLINSIERMKGLNEFKHLVSQLQQGAYWSIYTIIGILHILLWWVIFLLKNMKTDIFIKVRGVFIQVSH
ncbi:hypothetical protein ACIQAA_27940 [Neobacillus sp. NPDC093182]|uniref:hypothetical protein n=1 Tax=Neobacillus sp. NPDC093182 TaxID=3364297 RepID=UPI0037F564AF